jgi:hypothetical protein
MGPPDTTVAKSSSVSPFLEIRLVRPQVQGERLIRLFEGSRSPHPAAALAAFRAAKAGRSGLSKGAEALIAALNPMMVSELRLFDETSIQLTRTADGQIVWNALIPHDDGALASVATAFALTDGASLPTVRGLEVDRLGPAGAPVMAHGPGLKQGLVQRLAGAGDEQGLVIASSPDQIAPALDRLKGVFDITGSSNLHSGIHLELDARALKGPGTSLTARRLGEGLIAYGLPKVGGQVRLIDEALTARVEGKLESSGAGAAPTLDPSWVDDLPIDQPLAFALAIDPSPKAWDSLFAWIDRVEKVDPERANVAPSRLRLAILLAPLRIRPETDIFPILKGVSGHGHFKANGNIDSLYLRIHTIDAIAAKRLASETLPKLLERLGVKVEKVDDLVQFQLDGKPAFLLAEETRVILSWGNQPKATSDQRLNTVLRSNAGDDGSLSHQRLLVFWPGRMPGLGIEGIEPVIWRGGTKGNISVDEIRWKGAKVALDAFLEKLPLKPPANAATPFKQGQN